MPATSAPTPLSDRDPNKPSNPAQQGTKRKPDSTTSGEQRPNKTAKHTKSKKADIDALLDTGDVTLPGEDTGSVPVYDTCGEIRRKIRALLAKGVSQAALSRTLSKMLPGSQGQVSSRNIGTFMKQKHLMDGNTSPAFYAGYVFFEKQRIKNGKPKTKTRQEMEEAHGKTGVDLDWSFKGGSLTLFRNERAHVDKFGRIQITKQ
ncbi:unnamed protein product [Clonostachys rhizophaga]|uniref:DUF7726 domain-containing protein n=1 Tax=Clonostachys rhizophaga TaxID=160324 RepID=A0A9N9VSK4_9HYPO|nr:unnamed protein product [Clonostachys rhizophaga]